MYFFSINVYCKIKKNKKIADRSENLTNNKTWADKCWKLLAEFSEKTSLNGIKYIGDGKRHWLERSDLFNSSYFFISS